MRFSNTAVAQALGLSALVLILAEGGLTTCWAQPELAEAVHDMQGYKYPVDWIGCLLTRLGYPWVAARFICELCQPGISGGEHLVIEAPQQVGTPLSEIYDPWCQPRRMEGEAQSVNWRDEQLRSNVLQQYCSTHVARDNVPLAVNYKGRIGIMAGE